MNAMLASALEFAQLGCRVVPCVGKNPGGRLGNDWQHKATRDESTLRAWWGCWPNDNVGVVPDRACVPLDVDNPAGFERFQGDRGPAPTTPRYYTGGAEPPGRERLLLAWDERIQHADRKLADGLQLRHWKPGSVLMSVVPPSIHPDTGVELEWRIGLDEAPLAPLPEAWLERVLSQPDGPRGRPTDEWVKAFRRTYRTGCGETHPNVVAMAGYLVRRLGSGQVALELLLAWNETHCQPPKPAEEITEIVAYVARKEARRGRPHA